LTTADLLKKPICLVVNPDAEGHAEGTLFIDSGISRLEISNGEFRYYKLVHNDKSLQKQIAGGNSGNFFAKDGSANAMRPEVIDRIWITNADRYKKVNFGCLIDNDFKTYKLNAVYHPEKNTI
jgi:hypothetical protein